MIDHDILLESHNKIADSIYFLNYVLSIGSIGVSNLKCHFSQPCKKCMKKKYFLFYTDI